MPRMYASRSLNYNKDGDTEFDGDDKTVSYKIGKSGDPDGDLTGTDFEAIANKNISVTPLFWDMTNLEKVKGKLPNV